MKTTDGIRVLLIKLEDRFLWAVIFLFSFNETYIVWRNKIQSAEIKNQRQVKLLSSSHRHKIRAS